MAADDAIKIYRDEDVETQVYVSIDILHVVVLYIALYEDGVLSDIIFLVDVYQ